MVEEVGEVFESDGAGSGEFSVITDPSAAPVVGPPLSSRGSGSDTRRTTEAGSLGPECSSVKHGSKESASPTSGSSGMNGAHNCPVFSSGNDEVLLLQAMGYTSTSRLGPGFQFPWCDERLASVFGIGEQTMRTAPFVPMPRKRPSEQDKETDLLVRDESKVRKTSSWMRQTESKQWEVVLDEDRKRSLAAWVLLVLDNPRASVAGMLIHQEDQDGQLSVLADIFRAKATATLRARASALLAYMRWGRAEHGRTFTLFPVKEVVVYEYLCFLRDTRSPPTKAERFVQALAFCKGTLQADVDNVLASSRIKGATIPIEGHRVVRKKRPLTVAQVADLERRASTDESATGVFCGYLCFLVHGRLRWSDGQYVAEEPTIDTGPDGAGSLEAGLYYHKTANRQKSVIRRLLPAACSLPGVSGLPWAQTWLQNRAKHGLRAKRGYPMMPAPLASGKWDSIPLGTAEAIVWMKEVLQDAQGDVGTHSCKATALSWMAKANVDRRIRRLGGYHVAPGDRSMTEYSRDAQSPVLHALSGLYLAIRGGLFSPDASRSGRWNGCHNLEDAVKVLAAAPLLPVDSEPTGEDNSSGDSSGKSTSSSSSEGEEVDDEVVRADQAMAVLAAPAQLVQEDMAFYLLNVKSQVAHIPRPGTYGDEDGEMEVSKCGLIASAGFRKVDLFPEQIMRKCAKCFPCRQRQ